MGNNLELKTTEFEPFKIYQHESGIPFAVSAGSVIPILEPLPVPVQFKTLTGISKFLLSDNPEFKAIFIQDFNSVEFADKKACEIDGRRSIYATAKMHENSGFPFGRFQTQEETIIGLMTKFVDSPERAELIKFVGNIKAERSVVMADDGVSQRVAIARSISSQGSAVSPLFWKLRPYRTFPEVEQPESLFYLRFQDGKEGTPPGVALFDADGGLWRVEAIKNIRDFFVKIHGEDCVIG